MEDDSSYNSEAEPDSDTEESSGLEDPEALLQTWLGELDSLNMVSTAYLSASQAIVKVPVCHSFETNEHQRDKIPHRPTGEVPAAVSCI